MFLSYRFYGCFFILEEGEWSAHIPHRMLQDVDESNAAL